MRTPSILLAALLTSIALAGCASDEPEAAGGVGSISEEEIEEGAAGLGLKSTATTGIIRGIVVDSTITPIAGATASVRSGEKDLETTTTEAGVFGFAGLSPGTYFVKVAKPGYEETQQSVDVEAGVDAPPILKVQLASDGSFVKPYFQAYVFKGFIECSTTTAAPGVVGVGFAACSFVNDQAGTNLTTDNPQVQYPLAPVPTFAQSEMVWTPTQALGNTLNLAWSRDCGEDNAGFLCDYEVSGTTPLVLSAGGPELANITLQEGSGENVLYIRVFNEAPAETQGTVGITFEQSFDVYTHLFYGYAPPAGWQFSRDGDAKPPMDG